MSAVDAARQEFSSPLTERWEALKSLLQQESGDNNFRSWIMPITPKALSSGVLELAVPTRFMRDWVKTHYADRIQALWSQNFGALVRVDVTVSSVASPQRAIPVTLPAAANDTAVVADFSSPLDPRYTFDTFVVGASNALAAAAARKVAESDAALFNPLYIYGSVGLGKTHLLHATAAAVRLRKPQAVVAYMSAERFMYRFVQALRNKDTMSFKSFFRTADALLIDDIQFICGKESTQDEFLHAFNALIDHGKQVIVSADRPPHELDGTSDRLRSRLGMGLAVKVENTTPDLRVAILKSKTALLKRDVPLEVIDLLASRITSSVRELEGGLNRLIAHAELTGQPVSTAAALPLLQDLLRPNGRGATMDDIQKKTVEHYGLRIADMTSPRRTRAVARPRQVAMYLCKTLTEHSLPDIGRKFGGRDHTTVIHAVRTIEALIASDPVLARDVEALKREMTQVY